jgi:predicted nucleic acid-binding protein
VISRFANEVVASNVADLLLIRSNVEKYDIYYNWRLIVEDYDDNKFVDLAVASNSDYIVSNDKHFKILEKLNFLASKLLIWRIL